MIPLNLGLLQSDLIDKQLQLCVGDLWLLKSARDHCPIVVNVVANFVDVVFVDFLEIVHGKYILLDTTL